MKRTITSVLVAILALFSAGAQNLGLNCVAIDPGHGGTDPGAVSRDNKNYEKTFTLDIAKRLSEKIKAECPGVKVILTRDKDKSVALNDRAAIANKADADLFISIHINAAASTTPNGYSVHVLGQSSNKNRDLFAYNMDVCKRENAVILLEDDYTTTYQGFDPSDPESFIFLQLMQNSNLEQSLDFATIVADNLKGGPIKVNRGVWQDPFLVLWRTAMPAVLVELGFISNSTDLTTLRSADNRDRIASRLCAAFKEYKAKYDGSLVLDVEVENNGTDQKEEKVVKEDKPVKEVKYGIQIFAGAKRLDSRDKAFMGYTPYVLDTGKILKYVIAVGENPDEVKSHLVEIRKKYPDAFLVKIENGKASLLK
ncbi:MAG: N-acetylmuramoyl-L-alanine amidase [Bacteroidales bacterium]|nr:N-acetylmuramoyl-L-alanine amidase [Bacteroidales bacterium]